LATATAAMMNMPSQKAKKSRTKRRSWHERFSAGT
jgi:hypothetical protein